MSRDVPTISLEGFTGPKAPPKPLHPVIRGALAIVVVCAIALVVMAPVAIAILYAGCR